MQTLLAGLEGGQAPVGKQHPGNSAAADGALESLSVRELRRRTRPHLGNFKYSDFVEYFYSNVYIISVISNHRVLQYLQCNTNKAVSVTHDKNRRLTNQIGCRCALLCRCAAHPAARGRCSALSGQPKGGQERSTQVRLVSMRGVRVPRVKSNHVSGLMRICCCQKVQLLCCREARTLAAETTQNL